MTEPIPVLTLWQPWASLIALGAKRIETRPWATRYRGPLAIHAAARAPRDTPAERHVGDFRLVTVGRTGWAMEGPGLPEVTSTPRAAGYRLPLGVIVAVCDLVDVVPIVEASKDAPETGPWLHAYFSDLTGERAAWLMRSRSDGSIDTVDRRTGELPYGDFTQGRFAWLLDGIRPLDEPVPFKGGQRLTRRWTPEATMSR